MSKAIIVVDFAYKGPKRKGHGTGRKGLHSTLKYLQYRDNRTDHLAQTEDDERWRDFGLGKHYREIFEITRLSDFMAIFPDEATALKSVPLPAT